MKTLLLGVSSFVIASGCAAADIAEMSCGISNQKSVAVTVYNGGFGVVRDEREMTVPVGSVNLKFMDIAERVQPETVRITPLSAGDKLRVIEQNYEYDLLSPQKLLEKYVGHDVTLIQYNEFKDARIPVEATLLSYNDNLPIFSIDGEIVIHRPREEIRLPALPENLVASPTLIWRLVNAFEEPQKIVATYMTGGMRWNADYVAVLGRDDASLDLNGWVTVNNDSGATFSDAHLVLVAGDVHREQPRNLARGKMMFAADTAPPAPEFRQEGLFEYHMYTLDTPTTLKQNQQKQLALLEGKGVDVTTSYRVYGQQHWYRSRTSPGMKDVPVGVYLTFTNSAANSLGMPLPAGTVRVYKADSSGRPQFVGEDGIDHTPENEDVELHLGNAFDVVAERVQTSYRKLGDNTTETAWKVTLRNHKDGDVVVTVVEPFNGDWSILDSSLPYVKKTAFSAEFSVPVKANGETMLTYRVSVRR